MKVEIFRRHVLGHGVLALRTSWKSMAHGEFTPDGRLHKTGLPESVVIRLESAYAANPHSKEWGVTVDGVAYYMEEVN